jgi:glycine cleavage system H protein
MVPNDLRYTAEHEWVRITDEGLAEFGITDFAQAALGDIVYVSLPAVGDALTAGRTCGEVESTKSVSDIYSPVDGSVIERNEGLDDAPETLNGDPYGAGWLVRVKMTEGADLSGLLGASDYESLTTAS